MDSGGLDRGSCLLLIMNNKKEAWTLPSGQMTSTLSILEMNHPLFEGLFPFLPLESFISIF